MEAQRIETLQRLPLRNIRRDNGMQMRESISEATVVTYAEHMKDGVAFPPVTVFEDRTEIETVYWLADGFHRCTGYERAEIEMVPVTIIEGSRLDAVRYALKANATNGKPRSYGDLTRAYRMAVENGICEADDKEAVKAILNCGKSSAFSLTKEARDEAKKARQEKIISLKEEGKANRDIAEIVGCGSSTVDRVTSAPKFQSGILGQDEEEETTETIADLEAKEATKKVNAYKKKEKEKRKQEKEQKKAINIPEASNEEFSELSPGWHRIGNHYLYCGSNLDDAFREFVPKATLAFADPPYNAGVDDWDSGFVWQQDFIEEMADYVAVTPGGWNAFGFYQQTKMTYQWEMACWIRNGMTHGRCGYANWIKASIFGKKPKIKQDFFDITIKTSETEETSHKGRKPYPFMSMILDTFTDPGDIVVDPFGGSGTTLLVAQQLGRTAYLAELCPEYCAGIVNRALELGCDYEQL